MEVLAMPDYREEVAATETSPEAARVITEDNYNANCQPTDGFLGAVTEHCVVAAGAKFSDKPCYPACP